MTLAAGRSARTFGNVGVGGGGSDRPRSRFDDSCLDSCARFWANGFPSVPKDADVRCIGNPPYCTGAGDGDGVVDIDVAEDVGLVGGVGVEREELADDPREAVLPYSSADEDSA